MSTYRGDELTVILGMVLRERGSKRRPSERLSFQGYFASETPYEGFSHYEALRKKVGLALTGRDGYDFSREEAREFAILAAAFQVDVRERLEEEHTLRAALDSIIGKGTSGAGLQRYGPAVLHRVSRLSCTPPRGCY